MASNLTISNHCEAIQVSLNRHVRLASLLAIDDNSEQQYITECYESMLPASIHGFAEKYPPGDDNAEEEDETCELPRLYWFSFT
jgi:hypothetical protein